MSTLVETFLSNALQHKTVQSTFQSLLSSLLEMLTPILLGLAVLWGLILLGIVAILVILLRRGNGGV